MVIPRGNINSLIWAVQFEPSEADTGHGTLLSGSEGFHFDKMCREIGLPTPYVTCLNENSLNTGTDYDSRLLALTETITAHKSPIILGLGNKICEIFVPETKNYKKSKNGKHETKLDKWAGSILISPLLNYPHYFIPLWEPKYIFMDWAYRDIYKFIDLGHVKDEYDYFRNNGTLCPLPSYSITTSPSYPTLLDYLYYCRDKAYIGSDIETIRPAKSSKLYKGHSGYFYTISLAASRTEACSFSLWDYTNSECGRIWTELDYLLKYVPQIGQNYIQFDTHHMEALGFSPSLKLVHDTRIRHHILWPEMPHSLQFQTKQYTRQKYYKDEGKTWKPSQKTQLMNYNCLDTLVDVEIFEKQEEEFNERPHLR